MKCKKCGSENINIQMIVKSKLKTKHHGIIWWICIGWWYELCLWLILSFPKLLFTIFGHKKQKIVQKEEKHAVCQDCGYDWKI